METIWPWERKNNSAILTFDDVDDAFNFALKQTMFRQRCHENEYLDISTKIAAIKAASFVVSLVVYSNDKEISQGSGTIIEEDGTILTSTKLLRCPSNKNKVVVENLKINVHLWNGKSYEADLLAHDFYFGIAIVKIQQDATLPFSAACLRRVDDCISVDPNELHIDNDDGFQPRSCSNTYKLVPGDKVIALGRYFTKPYDLMAAPGQFSIKRFYKNESKELFRATCLITEIGIGGPLINWHGEVIGISSYDFGFTPFVPVNVAMKWWEWKKDKKLHRQPLIGMKLANTYSTKLQYMEKVLLKFSNDFVGIIVEEVEQGSSADIAGLRPNDIIVKCCGKPVRSYLEFFDMMWDKAGGSVELAVLRVNADAQLDLSMEVVGANMV